MRDKETPPRTWGRRDFRRGFARKRRNTPTHVGKTGAGGVVRMPVWKHPHARGEDYTFTAHIKNYVETPPRTWGRPSGIHQRSWLTRNTPTHVGKTPSKTTGGISHRKHPHARGEDYSSRCPETKYAETPPRTWGRRLLFRFYRLIIRNTPTHVGKTNLVRKSLVFSRKHPHARGEDQIVRASV